MFEHNEDEITTADDAKRVIGQIAAEQKRLSEANRSLSENLEAKVADLKTAHKALAEAQNRAKDHGPGTAAVRDFIHTRADGSPVVRWASGLDDNEDFQPGLIDTPSDDTWVQKMQELVSQRTMVRAMTRGKSHRAAPGESPKTDRAIQRHLERAPAPLQRLFSDASTTGAEFIPDLLSPTLESELRQARRVEALFQEVPMAGKELRIPFLSTELRPYKKVAITGDDPAAYTSSTIVTAQRSITASGLAVRAQLDEETTEDSVVAGLPLHRTLLIEALVDGTEDCIINGDSAASHQDTIASWDIRSRWGSSGLGGTADHRRCWLGLRAYAADNSSTVNGSGAETLAGILSDRAAMDSPHGTAGDLVMIVSPEYYLAKMLDFEEIQTIDKFGPSASVVSGSVSKIAGMPVVLSEFVGADLAATGLFTGSGAKTGYLLVNRNRWKMAVRRQAVVEIDKDVVRGIINCVSTVRKTLFSIDSTKKNVVWSYNHSIA